MNDEIKGNGFVMRPSPEPKKRTAIEYARAWLTDEVPSVNVGPGPMFPASADVLSVLQEEPNLAQQFIRTNVDVRELHETAILEKVSNGYDVYMTFESKKQGVRRYDNLPAALYDYLTLLGLR